MDMNSLLVVEDDSAWRGTLVNFFQLEGFDVESASSTREAMSRLEQKPFPIVVSDIYLDERTGLDVLRAARKAYDGCAVILMTGRGSMETVMAATEGNVFEYLAKPSSWTVSSRPSSVRNRRSAARTTLSRKMTTSQRPR
jgi:DNA-binding NtrC family response regulator